MPRPWPSGSPVLPPCRLSPAISRRAARPQSTRCARCDGSELTAPEDRRSALLHRFASTPRLDALEQLLHHADFFHLFIELDELASRQRLPTLRDGKGRLKSK